MKTMANLNISEISGHHLAPARCIAHLYLSGARSKNISWYRSAPLAAARASSVKRGTGKAGMGVVCVCGSININNQLIANNKANNVNYPGYETLELLKGTVLSNGAFGKRVWRVAKNENGGERRGASVE